MGLVRRFPLQSGAGNHRFDPGEVTELAIPAPVMAAWPQGREIDLRDGEVVAAGSVRLVAVHTPGHAPDHVVFHDPASRILFTGDAVLGRGTSVIDPPEGDMAAYIRSLEVMA